MMIDLDKTYIGKYGQEVSVIKINPINSFVVYEFVDSRNCFELPYEEFKQSFKLRETAKAVNQVNFSLKMYEVNEDRVKFEDLNVSINKDIARNFLTEMYNTKDKLKTKHYGEALELLGINDDILETLLHENSKINFDFLDQFEYEEEKLDSSAIHIATLHFEE